MKHITHFSVFVCLVALFSFGFQCEKNYIPQKQKYNLKVPVNISPLKKTYMLGDTVWFETAINGKLLFDTISNQNVLLDSTGLQANVYCLQLASSSSNPPDGLCQVVSSSFSNISRQLNKGVVFVYAQDTLCGNTSLNWRLGVKPNYRGNFLISVWGASSIQYCVQRYDGTYSWYGYQYTATDLNKDVYDALPDSVKKNDSYTRESLNSMVNNRQALMVKVQ